MRERVAIKRLSSVSRKRVTSTLTISSLAGNPMQPCLKETLKAESLMEKGRPGFPVNVQRQVRLFHK